MQLPLFPDSLERPETSSTVDAYRVTMARVASVDGVDAQYASSPWTVGNHRRKVDQWHVRFYADEKREEARALAQRVS